MSTQYMLSLETTDPRGGCLCDLPRFPISLELGPLATAGEAAKGHLMCPRSHSQWMDGALNPGPASAPKGSVAGSVTRACARLGHHCEPSKHTPASEALLGEASVATPDTGRPAFRAGDPGLLPWMETHRAQGWGARLPRERTTLSMPVGPGPHPQHRTPAPLPALQSLPYGVRSGGARRGSDAQACEGQRCRAGIPRKLL